MAGRHTRQTQQVGYLHLTVEAEPLANPASGPWPDANVVRHRNLHEVTREIAQVFDDHGLAATWAVGDPAHSAVTELVASSDLPHELALVGDRHWLGPTAGRKRFAHELARRVSQAQAAGIELTTLMPRVAPVTEHIDLIVKHAIRAIVRKPDAGRRPDRSAKPKLLHYGVWELAATSRLPQPSAWLPVNRWRLVRSLASAAARAETFHLLIDATQTVDRRRTTHKTIAALAKRAEQLRDSGLLRVETLAAATARLADLPTTIPQRSILHAA